MTDFARRLKKCREDRKKDNPEWTQGFAANKIGVARSTYTAYENGTKMPPFDTINRIADLFNVKTDFLMGRTDNPTLSDNLPKLTAKDELDMAKRMAKMKEDLIEGRANGQALLHKGEPMSEEAMESLLEALEMAERITTLANKKYAPNKYKGKE